MSDKLPTLHTTRLLLRAFDTGDVADVQGYLNDEEWARYEPDYPQPFGRADAERFVARRIVNDWEAFPFFAIELSGAVVGGVSMQVDLENMIAEIGYGVARAHWGEGLASEAARAMLDWSFPHYGLAKVFARTDPRNVGSWRVMEKLGMRREALWRSHAIGRYGREDEVIYGLLRDEF